MPENQVLKWLRAHVPHKAVKDTTQPPPDIPPSEPVEIWNGETIVNNQKKQLFPDSSDEDQSPATQIPTVPLRRSRCCSDLREECKPKPEPSQKLMLRNGEIKDLASVKTTEPNFQVSILKPAESIKSQPYLPPGKRASLAPSEKLEWENQSAKSTPHLLPGHRASWNVSSVSLAVLSESGAAQQPIRQSRIPRPSIPLSSGEDALKRGTSRRGGRWGVHGRGSGRQSNSFGFGRTERDLDKPWR